MTAPHPFVLPKVENPVKTFKAARTRADTRKEHPGNGAEPGVSGEPTTVAPTGGDR